MSQSFYTDLDLHFNELLQAILENIDSTTISSGQPGRVFWCTANQRIGYWDGTEVKLIRNVNDTINATDVITDVNNRFVTDTDINNWNQLITDIAARGQEYFIKIFHAVNNVLLTSFRKDEVRALKLIITVEDSSGNGTMMNTVNLLFDGNYPTFVEYAQLNSVLNNEITLYTDHDADNVYFYLKTNSVDFNVYAKVEVFEYQSDIIPTLVPQDDLLLANGLLLRP